MKNKTLISLLIIVSTILVSCNSSPYPYEYPEEYTAENCFEKYELFDPNITYTECYEFVSEKNWGIITSFNFSAIKDCDDLSFMVCYKTIWGPGRSIQVVRNRNSDINPTTYFTPSKVELIWYTPYYLSNLDAEKETEKYHNSEAQYLSETVMMIDSAEAIDEIMSVATKDTVLSHYMFVLEQRNTEIYDSKLNGIHSEKGSLYVKVSFEECAGLVLIGKIMVDKDNLSYMEHVVYHYDNTDRQDATSLKASSATDCLTHGFRYRLGESMDDFVQQAIESIE